MNYKTRHLEALSEIPLGNKYHHVGARFFATPVDAEYLIKHNKASEVPAAAPAAAALPQQEPEAPALADAINTESTAAPATGEPASAPAPVAAPRRRSPAAKKTAA